MRSQYILRGEILIQYWSDESSSNEIHSLVSEACGTETDRQTDRNLEEIGLVHRRGSGR